MILESLLILVTGPARLPAMVAAVDPVARLIDALEKIARGLVCG